MAVFLQYIWLGGVLAVLIICCNVDEVECRRRRSKVAKPFINDPDCPRKPDLTSKRKCLKKCRDDTDCKGKNKVCRCDDVCGWSCVKATKKCVDLKNIANGDYELKPKNVFGATVRYWCNDGYELEGSEVRVCQGDGHWSGSKPTCVGIVLKCEDPQSIPQGTYEMVPSNTVGSRLRYKCDEGFMLRGQPERICRSDGKWSGLPPFCETDDRCKNPPTVAHATHSGMAGQTIFPVGAQLVYECHPGYKTDGFAKAMCVSDSKWVGPRMSCQPRRCLHPGDIQFATRTGSSFVYPKKVTYKCVKGYHIIGRDFRVCQQNGEWSGVLPQCKPVRCSKLSSPLNGRIIGQGFTYGSQVSYTCIIGFKLVGSPVRRCLEDSTWSGEETSCILVDCGNPGPFPNGNYDYDNSGKTTYGTTIRYRCLSTATFFEGEKNFATCQSNGNWSSPVPRCMAKCRLDDIRNGSVLYQSNGEYIQHNQTMRYRCNPGFRKPIGISAVCNNGTFDDQPTCEPEPCNQRPKSIRDGMVRYFTSNHNDLARYKCNTGYKLIGQRFVTCQYGNWTGEPPICEPDYCDFPGTIENGQILLVGVIGKYEYRKYVKKIGHNDRIEYHCNKTFKRIGPVGATCVAGEWSPIRKPKCVHGKHPKLQYQYLYRGKRSLDYVPNNSSQHVYKQENEKGYCELPKIANGNILHSAGQYLPHGHVIKVVCKPGYIRVPKAMTSTCDDGIFSVVHECIKVY